MSKRNEEILDLLEALKNQTNTLLANQLLYNEMVENNVDGLLVVNSEGIIQFANKTAAKMFNQKKAKKLEGEVFGFHPIENTTTEIEIANDNKVTLVEMRSSRIEWDGRFASLVLLRSLTDRSKVRSSLQKISESLKAIIHASPLAIVVLDLSGSISLWSRAAERIFGWSEIEIRGQDFPFKNSPLEEVFERTLAGERFFEEELEGEFGLYGLSKIIHVWATPLSNSTGTTHGVMLMIADMSEIKFQKQAMERALSDSENRFRIALKNSPISVSSQDTNLRYTWVYKPMAGLNEIDILGQNDETLFSPEEAAQLTELKRSVLKSNSVKRAQIKLQRNGIVYFYDISVEPMTDPKGKIIGITSAATDVSALRQTQATLLNEVSSGYSTHATH